MLVQNELGALGAVIGKSIMLNGTTLDVVKYTRPVYSIIRYFNFKNLF